MMKILVNLSFAFILGACAQGNCRSQKKVTPALPATEATEVESSASNRIKIHKPDGTLQCGQGKLIPIEEMQKQLGKIKVYSAKNQNDGMMRIQVCGSPTGNSNVYEIDRKDLEEALKAGFQEWMGE